MAERMIRRNYEAMIEALYEFGSRTAQISNEIQKAADSCRNALDEEDTGVAKIYQHASQAQTGYRELTLKALHIAKAMAEELSRGELERMLWDDDEADASE